MTRSRGCSFQFSLGIVSAAFLRFESHRTEGKQEVLTFEVKLPSACSFIVDGLVFCCRCSHYMFRPTWPSSGV
jgi:hypothetical protein